MPYIDDDDLEVHKSFDDLKHRLQEIREAYSHQYDTMHADLLFLSGDQWPGEEVNIRSVDKQPTITVPILRPYVDRITAPLRLTPLDISVSLKDAKLEKLINGVLGGICRASGDSEPFVKAMEHAVSVGVGWLVCEVVKERGRFKGNSVIRWRAPRNPCSIYLDPYAQEIDGSDAKYAFEIGYLEKSWAKKQYGDDIDDDALEIARVWDVPAKSVTDIICWELKDDPKYEGLHIVECSRWVGSKKVAHAEYPIEALPVIPVYGDVNYSTNNDRHWSGLVDRARSTQQLLNYYHSSALEMAKTAPKAPFIGPRGTFEGLEKSWSEVNTRNYAWLEFNMVTGPDGQPAPTPTRLDNQPQIQALQILTGETLDQLGRVTGIPDNLLQGATSTTESGAAITARLGAAELATAHYNDHLAKSMSQLGRVTCDLMPAVYVGERSIVVVDVDNKASRIEIDLHEVMTPEVLSILDVQTSGGPALEQRRKQAVQSMETIMQISASSNPGLVSQILPEYIELLDIPNSESIVRKLKGEPDTNAPEGQMDPQVQQTLQTAQQTIQTLEQHAQVLEQQIQQLQSEQQLKIQLAQLDAQTKIQVATINNQGKTEAEALKQGAESQRTAAIIQSEFSKESKDMVHEIVMEGIKQKHDVNIEQQHQQHEVAMHGLESGMKAFGHAIDLHKNTQKGHLDIAMAVAKKPPTSDTIGTGI